jgi:hypothetical protein
LRLPVQVQFTAPKRGRKHQFALILKQTRPQAPMNVNRGIDNLPR